MAINASNAITDALGNIDFGSALSKIPGFQSLVNVGIAVGILFLVYIVFLIIRSITQILYSIRIKNVVKNIEEINQKMDVLISKFDGKAKKIKK